MAGGGVVSAKMKRRRRHDRLKRVLGERRERREDLAFYEHGTIPASATGFAQCSCGARTFTRGNDRAAHASLDEFYDAHAYCDEVAW